MPSTQLSTASHLLLLVIACLLQQGDAQVRTKALTRDNFGRHASTLPGRSYRLNSHLKSEVEDNEEAGQDERSQELALQQLQDEDEHDKSVDNQYVSAAKTPFVSFLT